MTPYKMHLIVPSEVMPADSGNRLYEVRGRFSKPAAHQPFLPSIRAAKEWIDEQRLAASLAASPFVED